MRPSAALLALLALVPATASAIPAVRREFSPAVLHGPETLSPTPLVVAREEVYVDCGGLLSRRCRYRAEYALSNPTDKAERITGAFYGFDLDDIRVKAGTESVEVRLGPEGEGLDALVWRAQEDGDRDPANGSATVETEDGLRVLARDRLVRQGFSVEVAAHAERPLTVEGTFWPRPEPRWPRFFVLPAVFTRHVFSVEHVPDDEAYQLEYALPEGRTLAPPERVTLALRVPRSWGASGLAEPRGRREAVPEGRSGVRDLHRGPLVLTGETATTKRLRVRLEPPNPLILGGGLLMGIGGTFGDGARARIGYEVAVHRSWLLASANAESNFHDRLILTPLLQVASPEILFVPSIGLGAGVPFQIAPTTAAGVRFQAGFHFPVVGFAVDLDVFPTLPRKAEVTLMATLGL